MFIVSRPITAADNNALKCILSEILARQTIEGTQKYLKLFL